MKTGPYWAFAAYVCQERCTQLLQVGLQKQTRNVHPSPSRLLYPKHYSIKEYKTLGSTPVCPWHPFTSASFPVNAYPPLQTRKMAKLALLFLLLCLVHIATVSSRKLSLKPFPIRQKIDCPCSCITGSEKVRKANMVCGQARNQGCVVTDCEKGAEGIKGKQCCEPPARTPGPCPCNCMRAIAGRRQANAQYRGNPLCEVTRCQRKKKKQFQCCKKAKRGK